MAIFCTILFHKCSGEVKRTLHKWALFKNVSVSKKLLQSFTMSWSKIYNKTHNTLIWTNIPTVSSKRLSYFAVSKLHEDSVNFLFHPGVRLLTLLVHHWSTFRFPYPLLLLHANSPQPLRRRGTEHSNITHILISRGVRLILWFLVFFDCIYQISLFGSSIWAWYAGGLSSVWSW